MSETKRGPGKPPVPAEEKYTVTIPIHMTAADRTFFEEFLSTTKPRMSWGKFFREAGRAFIAAKKSVECR